MAKAKPNTESTVVEMKVVTRLQDNGDGGYTMHVYNNEDELIANHPKMTDFRKNPETGKYEYVPIELPANEMKALIYSILHEDDPYENGYIGNDTIKVKISPDGTVSLAQALSFHAGQ